MNDANKALLVGFIIGALVLGIAGFLLAPHLLALAGVAIGHAAMQYTAVIATMPVIIGTPSTVIGVTAASFSQLQAGIAAFMGLIGGLAGGLIGVSASKAESNSLPQHTVAPLTARVSSEEATGNEHFPQLDTPGKNTKKSFVSNYEQEKAAQTAAPSSQLSH